MWIFAHRGAARSRREENTVVAFRRALAAGCQLETDGRISDDGMAVLVHDSLVYRFPPRRYPLVRRVHQIRAAQLARFGIPTIDDLYGALGADFQLSIDLKVADVGPLLIAAAERFGAAERLWLVSDRLDVLNRLRAISPEVRLVHESRAGTFGDGRDHSDRLAAASITAQNTALDGWTDAAVAYSHACGVGAFGSLVNDRAGFDRAASLGLDALYTDRLDLAGAVAG